MTETTELELAPSGALSERMKYAQALAAADLLPTSYRRKPANILLAMEYGHALGLDTITAIQSVHVIEGKPTASAQLIGGLVRRAGHKLRVTGDDKHAVAEIIRRDDPDFVFRSEWTIARAQSAGLTGKGVWKQYPAAMLKARAITEVARDACPEALAGVAYTPEELNVDDLAPNIAPSSDPWTISEPITQVDIETGEIVEAEIVEQPQPQSTDGASGAQLKMLGALFSKCAVKDHDMMHVIASRIIGSTVNSLHELTKRQASGVIDVLKPLADAPDPVDALDAWIAA